jgi:hypothetical protein
LQAATAVLRQSVADHRIAGAVAAVARHGKLIYLEPVGLQDIASKTLMTDRSLFRIYSMTKSVTAVAVMMLVEEGKIRLTDPASRFLPEFKNAMVHEGGTGAARKPSREITIQDLLLHTSGLSHRTSDLYRTLNVRSRSIGLPQFIVNITKAPLMGGPGYAIPLQRGDDRSWPRRGGGIQPAVRHVRDESHPQATRHERHDVLGGRKLEGATDDRVSTHRRWPADGDRDRRQPLDAKAGRSSRAPLDCCRRQKTSRDSARCC